MKPQAALVFALCSYEVAALSSKGRLPTLTALAHEYRHITAGRAVIVGALGWLTHHLLIEREAARA